MKYRYTGKIPLVTLLGDDLIRIVEGQVLDLDGPLSPDFVAVSPPKVPPSKPKKPKTKKGVTPSSSTNISHGVSDAS
jgi:hypothetical protein